jgi:hypothetical protein
MVGQRHTEGGELGGRPTVEARLKGRTTPSRLMTRSTRLCDCFPFRARVALVRDVHRQRTRQQDNKRKEHPQSGRIWKTRRGNGATLAPQIEPQTETPDTRESHPPSLCPVERGDGGIAARPISPDSRAESLAFTSTQAGRSPSLAPFRYLFLELTVILVTGDWPGYCLDVDSCASSFNLPLLFSFAAVTLHSLSPLIPIPCVPGTLDLL